MAEYLPLLERAVAGLSDSNPDTRGAIYERARSALLGQLRRMEPPVPEEDIARESEALDEAIARIEATLAAPAPVAKIEPSVAPPLGTKTPSSSFDPVAAKPAPSRPQRAPPIAAPGSGGIAKPPGSATTPAPGISPPPARERPVLAVRPPAPIAPPTLRPPSSSEPSEKMPAAPLRPLRSARPLNTAPRVGIEPRVLAPPSELTTGSPDLPKPPPADGPPVVASLSTPRPAEGPASAPVVARSQQPIAPGDGLESSEPDARPDTSDEPPAGASASRRRAPALYVAAALGALLVAGVAVEAWRLRDRPEQVTADQQQATTEPAGKMVYRAAGESNPGPAAQDTTSKTALVPAPGAAGGGPEASSDTEVATPPAPAAAASEQTSTPSVGVAERAALLLDAPQDPQKVKTYVGSVVWKNQNVSAGQGQPLAEAIVADVDIPDAKMTMNMVMKQNTEPQFPASHTIEFRFVAQAGSDIGPVKQISVPDLRLDDNSPTGEPLTGLPVAITDNYFLVGLSRGDAEGANIKMLQKRNWFDVSLLLVSGKAAKITFEKGVPGQRIIDDALKSWQSGG